MRFLADPGVLQLVLTRSQVLAARDLLMTLGVLRCNQLLIPRVHHVVVLQSLLVAEIEAVEVV